MKKKHYIADGLSGDLEREYVEVNRNPLEGDYVIIKESCGYMYNAIRKVSDLGVDEGGIYVDEPVGNFNFMNMDDDEFYVLQPTSFFLYQGERCRLAKRNVQEGEHVVTIKDGIVVKKGYTFVVYDYGVSSVNVCIQTRDLYRVIVPVTEEKEEEVPAPETDRDLIVALSKTVARLERKLEEVTKQVGINKKDIQTVANDYVSVDLREEIKRTLIEGLR